LGLQESAQDLLPLQLLVSRGSEVAVAILVIPQNLALAY